MINSATRALSKIVTLSGFNFNNELNKLTFFCGSVTIYSRLSISFLPKIAFHQPCFSNLIFLMQRFYSYFGRKINNCSLSIGNFNCSTSLNKILVVRLCLSVRDLRAFKAFKVFDFGVLTQLNLNKGKLEMRHIYCDTRQRKIKRTQI